MGSHNDPLYFLHIPKTAGTAFRNFLEDHFDQAGFLRRWLVDEIAGCSPEELSAFSAFAGHHGWFLPVLIGREPRVLTLLRDPVDRSLSHFCDLRRRADNWIYPIIHENKWSFEDFVLSPLGQSELTNFMVRNIALDRVHEDYWLHSHTRDTDFPALKRKYTDPRMLDKAMDRASRFLLFGHVERFNDALVLTAHRLGWAQVRDFPKYNTRDGSRDNDEITPRAADALAEITTLDQALYNECVRRFDSDMAALTPESIAADYRRVMGALPRVERAEWSFERPINGGGWLVRDWCKHPIFPDRDLCVRRMNPDSTAFVDVPLASGRAYEVRLHVSIPGASSFPGIDVRANGVALDGASWWGRYDEQDGCVVSAALPADVIARSPEFTRVEFVARLTPSGAKPESPLVRWLGIIPAMPR